MKKFGAVCAYTMDGETRGEIEMETFSADAITITFQGFNTHPGYAKGKMINAIKVAADFINRLPKAGLTPEKTDRYDERLFFFGEELDLSWQLIEAGYEIRYAPDLVVRHKSSLERHVDWAGGRFYFNVRNMIYLNRKYLSGGGLPGAYAAGYVLKGLGAKIGDMVEVLDGLKVGDQIVLNPPERLRNGLKIKVAEK